MSAKQQTWPSRRRGLQCAAAATAFAIAATIAVGVTFGLFSATGATQTNRFSSGTVTTSSDASGACTVTNMLPGAVPTPCTLKATYSGKAPAYLGLDVLIETQAGSGGTKLYNPTDSTNALHVAISDNQGTPVAYTIPTTATACPSGAPANSTCYEIDDELVNKTGFAGAPPGSTITFTTSVSLPAGSTTGYQGGAAQIILTAHAIQKSNNGSTSTCTAGTRCTTVSWS